MYSACQLLVLRFRKYLSSRKQCHDSFINYIILLQLVNKWRLKFNDTVDII